MVPMKKEEVRGLCSGSEVVPIIFAGSLLLDEWQRQPVASYWHKKLVYQYGRQVAGWKPKHGHWRQGGAARQ